MMHLQKTFLADYRRAICAVMTTLLLLVATSLQAQETPLIHLPFDGSVENLGTAGAAKLYVAAGESEPSYVAGHKGQALFFANGGVVAVPLNFDHALYPRATVTAWIKDDTDEGSKHEILSAGSGAGLKLFLRDHAKAHLRIGRTVRNHDKDFAVGQWVFVAGVVDTESGLLKIWQDQDVFTEDGIQTTTLPPAQSVAPGDDRSNRQAYVYIGAAGFRDSASSKYPLAIDDVRLYGEALTAAQIEAIRDAGPASGTAAPPASSADTACADISPAVMDQYASDIGTALNWASADAARNGSSGAYAVAATNSRDLFKRAQDSALSGAQLLRNAQPTVTTYAEAGQIKEVVRSILETVPQAAHWASISAIYHTSRDAEAAFNEGIKVLQIGDALFASAGRCYMAAYLDRGSSAGSAATGGLPPAGPPVVRMPEGTPGVGSAQLPPAESGNTLPEINGTGDADIEGIEGLNRGPIDLPGEAARETAEREAQIRASGSNTQPEPEPSSTPTGKPVPVGEPMYSSVAGFAGSGRRTVEFDSTFVRSIGWTENFDRPCVVKISSSNIVVNAESQKVSVGCEDNDDLGHSQKSVSLDRNVYVGRLEVCNNNKANHRLKGIRIAGNELLPDGSLKFSPNTESSETANCAIWSPAVLCPIDSLATGLVVHFETKPSNSNEIVGLQLICRAIGFE